MATGKSGSVKKVLFILATILMIAFFFIDPFPGLEPAGMRFLGIFIWWIVLLVTELMPNYLACLAALVLSIAVGSATFEQAFGCLCVWHCWS